MGAPLMTDDIKDLIAELRELKGMSYGQISRRIKVGFGVDIKTGSISWYCLSRGIESPRNERKVLPQTRPGPAVCIRNGHEVKAFLPTDDARLLKMDDQGLTVSEMARRLGRMPNSVRGRLATLARHQARREASEARA